MKIAIGTDHAGVEMKNGLIEMMRAEGHEVTDHGTFTSDSVDYPDYAAAVGRSVADGDADRGVLICGTGLGVAIAANKIHGVRAATCNDLFSARLCRAHNDANVVTVGARIIGPDLAEAVVKAFLGTDLDDGPRHRRRLDKINALERAGA